MDNNEITIEDKAQYLRDNGWYTAWSENNWLQEGIEYTNPDWAGKSTEQAYEYAMRMNLKRGQAEHNQYIHGIKIISYESVFSSNRDRL